jgi:flavin reductase (DIM6/NTAB) family NADH-FMN oxidoreductase RutF
MMATRRAPNPMALRRMFGCFATGVTIVTTTGEDGMPVGVTANSFTSVSLDPPLLLVSLSRQMQSIVAFENAEYFTVNVLGSHQADLARLFGTRGSDKWSGIKAAAGTANVPIIPDAVAFFECRTHSIVPAGDHNLHIGHVINSLGSPEAAPLVFHAGQFTALADRSSGCDTSARSA